MSIEDSSDKTQSESASCLALIIRKHPALAELIERWFLENASALSDNEQVAIRGLLEQKE